MQGETAYLRVSDIQRDSLIVRLSYPGDGTTLFRITPGGELDPVRTDTVVDGTPHSSRHTLHAFRGT